MLVYEVYGYKSKRFRFVGNNVFFFFTLIQVYRSVIPYIIINFRFSRTNYIDKRIFPGQLNKDVYAQNRPKLKLFDVVHGEWLISIYPNFVQRKKNTRILLVSLSFFKISQRRVLLEYCKTKNSDPGKSLVGVLTH